MDKLIDFNFILCTIVFESKQKFAKKINHKLRLLHFVPLFLITWKMTLRHLEPRKNTKENLWSEEFIIKHSLNIQDGILLVPKERW